MTTAIKVENLGKKYIIGHEKQERYSTLRDSLAHSARSFKQRLQHPLQPNREETELEEFWALKDINFEIQQGDRVGIIGRNGAGKSTLLKILSRITAPTTGKVTINGRVASLLEVGTGFHPELSGRENIYLNGAILGMRKVEIKRKFDEIVDFAEVEKFLDTPVKRYSSGMYVRLAFAVAAHLEPEILVVDEVLAVGDVEFQKKCLGKMSDVSKEGRTILFVSHNMNAIEQLCDRAFLLSNGLLIQKSSDIRETIHDYLAYREGDSKQSEWHNTQDRYNDAHFKLTNISIKDDKSKVITKAIKNDQVINVVIEGEVEKLDKALQVGYAIYDDKNSLLFWSIFNDSAEKNWPMVKHGFNRFINYIPKRFLNEGTYRMEIIAALYFRYWIIEPQNNSPSIYFTIQGGLSESPYWMMRRPGIFAPELKWSID
ncbi:MAG: ABC transporter ATP-binding protein [Methylococcaceae bacterium]